MPESNDQKLKSLEIAKSQIAKQFGKDAIMTLDGDNELTFQESISTGCLSLDIALGVGGVPRGRVTEIYGPESSGKTTLALHIIAEAQKAGGYAAFIDAEHALDIYWAEKIGVNLKELQVHQPDSGEQALEVTEMLVRSNALDVIVIDSAAALVPRAELEGEMGDSHMGLQARLMSQALRKLTEPVKKSGTALIFINQIREKIGVVYGNPETTPGGRALKFYTSVRMEIRRVTTIKDGPDPIGNRTKVKVVKNKVSAPFKVIEFDIMYNEGISFTGDILDLAIKAEIIDKMGSWFSYGESKIGQGRENAKQFLIDNEKERKEIVEKVKAFIGVSEEKPQKKSES
ncbi:MAG: recombinase RecA [Candidatus Neomarinimicrobiota bacterium]|nr:recombinase RecA [Candidatus Neomarinimicrobiota bacterium]MEC7853938.1 recombinase RecA [Candidatus Neomarinimicrobiota bacterium]MEC7981612.1 recombinase RecA [Candidatus Neomarinimicrobiota bacterium]MEC8689807.1 recombinase RecA [Candidatus Neomarinimicrobiota bacterium]|tara:strand:+ start:411 stop:1442 length:1032 start_codon:yes stop_codon:yes gene_type:complete